MGTSNDWSEHKRTEKTGKIKKKDHFALCKKKGCLKFICRTFKTALFHVFVEYSFSDVVDDTGVHALIKKPLKKMQCIF